MVCVMKVSWVISAQARRIFNLLCVMELCRVSLILEFCRLHIVLESPEVLLPELGRDRNCRRRARVAAGGAPRWGRPRHRSQMTALDRDSVYFREQYSQLSLLFPF